ncbi:MAG: site-specific integrase [Acidobacteria bacterium]|nr:site-specific integrase [Acidobacteriota bacterium]
MAVKKFYSNKQKAGWKENPGSVPPEKIKPGEKQKDAEKKYYSWGYDIDLEPDSYDQNNEPIRNRRRESGFANRKDAETAAARLKFSEKAEKYNFKKQSFPTISQVLQAYLDRLISTKERTRAKTIFNRFLTLLESNVRLDELRTRHLKLYVQDRRGQIKDASINRELNNIASALHSAYLDFPILEDWVSPMIPRLKVARSRRERLITRKEVESLFARFFEAKREDESAADYRKRRNAGHAFQVAILTGARIGEIAGMRWEHIDWQGKTLQIHGQKSRYVSASTVRYLELTPTLEYILQTRKDLDEFGEFVFCRTGNSITHYYQIVEDVAKRAGLVYGQNKKGGFVTHDARHTAITQMLQKGIDLSTVGSITGHSDKTLILHYSHATRESRRIAGKVLDDFGSFGAGDVLDDDHLE